MYRSHLCFKLPPFHPGSASGLPQDKLTNSDNYKSKPISLYTQGEFGTCIDHTFVSCIHNTIHAALIGMSRRQFTIMSQQNLSKILKSHSDIRNRCEICFQTSTNIPRLSKFLKQGFEYFQKTKSFLYIVKQNNQVLVFQSLPQTIITADISYCKSENVRTN